MNVDIYSDRAKQAVQAAQSLALARKNQQFASEHLLKALLDAQDGLARDLIKQAGGSPDKAAAEIDAALAKVPQVEGGSGQLYMAPAVARVFAVAEEDAKKAGDAFVTTERLLTALAKDGQGPERRRRGRAQARGGRQRCSQGADRGLGVRRRRLRRLEALRPGSDPGGA
jgi:ATP-dependent Clp protease ATP-binding subunit ClpB